MFALQKQCENQTCGKYHFGWCSLEIGNIIVECTLTKIFYIHAQHDEQNGNIKQPYASKTAAW